MQLTQALRRNRSLHGERTATICDGRQRTWAEVCSRVARLAAGLRSLGVETGDRIGILGVNSDAYVEAYYAIAWAGCVFVPFNTRWARAEIDHALAGCRPRLMLVAESGVTHLGSFDTAGVPVVGLGAALGIASAEDLIAVCNPIGDQDRSGNDLAGIFYTGGTTGRSKGVMVSHDNLVTNFFLVQAMQPLDPGDTFLHAAPMFHMADASFLFGLTNLAATHVILPGFDPLVTVEAVERERVSAMLLVPTMMAMLCDALERKGGDMSSVRRWFYGASPISAGMLRRAMALLPNARFCQAYGQTEVSCCLTLLDHQDHLDGRLESAGRPLPACDVRVVDAALKDLPAGEVGEIVTRGPCVMQGYWEQPEATAEAIVGGWLRTGDAGRFDEHGYLYLVDRVKDMIVSGGENVFSVEVERALATHPDVVQCAVVGVPDERWGERVHAILQVRAGARLTEADLRAHCGPLLANYKQPRSFELRADSLPLSGVGKIAKAELRRPFWEGRARNIA
jgi:long-chain acyl-CoA synthetase